MKLLSILTRLFAFQTCDVGQVKAHKSSDPVDRQKFVDELIVNRELGANYCFYNPHYDSYDGLPDWAKATLEAHASDDRPAILTREQLENAQSPDPYWNAAQNEMLHDGYMHNYMYVPSEGLRGRRVGYTSELRHV